MSEVKIRFNTDYQVKAVGGQKYREGQTVPVSEASARHFIGRGVAELANTAKKAATKQADGE